MDWTLSNFYLIIFYVGDFTENFLQIRFCIVDRNLLTSLSLILDWCHVIVDFTWNNESTLDKGYVSFIFDEFLFLAFQKWHFINSYENFGSFSLSINWKFGLDIENMSLHDRLILEDIVSIPYYYLFYFLYRVRRTLLILPLGAHRQIYLYKSTSHFFVS